MNKKQLIVAWAIGLTISIMIFSVNRSWAGGIDFEISFKNTPIFGFLDLFRWRLPILIIGSLLIYTLRDKKK